MILSPKSGPGASYNMTVTVRVLGCILLYCHLWRMSMLSSVIKSGMYI